MKSVIGNITLLLQNEICQNRIELEELKADLEDLEDKLNTANREIGLIKIKIKSAKNTVDSMEQEGGFSPEDVNKEKAYLE